MHSPVVVLLNNRFLFFPQKALIDIIDEKKLHDIIDMVLN